MGLEKVGNLFKITKVLCARNQTQVYQSLNPCTFSSSRWSPKGKGYLDISMISMIKAAFLPEEVTAQGKRVSAQMEDSAGPGKLPPLGEAFSREAHR